MRICNGVYIYVYIYMILITFVKNAYKEKNILVGKFIYHFFKAQGIGFDLLLSKCRLWHPLITHS